MVGFAKTVQGVAGGKGSDGNVETALLLRISFVSLSSNYGGIVEFGSKTYANTLVYRLGRVVSCVGIESSRLLVPQHMPHRGH